MDKFGLKNQNSSFKLKFGIYNQFHNISRLFNVIPNFPFIASETMGDYYLSTLYLRVASRVAERLKTYGCFEHLKLLIETKENLTDNHVHNILRLFDGWANFPFTTSETKREY